MFRAYTEKKEQYFGDLPRSIIAEWELATKNEKSIQDSTTFKLHKEQQSKEKYIIILVSALLLLAFLLFYLIRNRKNILEREKINKEKQLIKFDLELKSKQLVSESLKSITIQNTKEELLHQLEEVIQELPKIHHTKFQQIIHNLKLNRTSSLLSEFEARFTGVYEQYYDKLKTIAPDLTPHELRICALMRLNIPTKEIAILTNRTTGTVDNTRSTIRKKLKLEDETNLQDYLLKL
jgi:DNA-binding CsgD family transcriptional regulator